MDAGSKCGGRLVTLEGGEGAGKSSLARQLAEHFSRAGQEVVLTREPGGSPGAEAIRSLILGGNGFDAVAEAMLMFAARREHLVTKILPALERGALVISDRFYDSTYAYQVVGGGVPRRVFEGLLDLALDGFRPDVTLVLDLPVEVGLGRAASRGVAADRYERLGLAFHEKVRAAFLEVAAAEPDRCRVIDATQPQQDVLLAAIQALCR